jgi:putative ABC transport system ATP-binding protein
MGESVVGDTLISLRGISKSYRRGGQVLPVLTGISFDIARGEFLSLMGPSGSGKSTLLNLIAGIDKPDAGELLVDGADIVVLGESELADWRASHVGFIFQFYNLMPVLTALENVELPLTLTHLTRRERREHAQTALELVGLSDRMSHYPSELSGGQQQRVALARALAPRPDVLLLDEPFTALDAALRVRLRAEVRELLSALGTTTVLVTHDQEEALSTADFVAVMRDGRFVQKGTPLEVYDGPVDLGVAHFVGDAVELPAHGRGDRVSCALGDIAVRRMSDASMSDVDGTVVLRPEQLVLSCPVDGAQPPGAGIVRETSYHGHDSLLQVELRDGTVIPVRVPGGTPPPRPGETVVVTVTGEGRVYPARTAPGTPCG